MDPFYAFLIFAALLVLEHLAAQVWFAPYFRFGIPVYLLAASLPAPLAARDAAQKLETAFRSKPEHPSIRFKPLGDRQVAFRESLFENRAGLKYLPIVHARLSLDPRRPRLAIVGFINWYVLGALVYIVYRSLEDRSFIPVALLILLIFGLSYAVQVGLIMRIAETLRKTGEVK